jgi:hypothetical protein
VTEQCHLAYVRIMYDIFMGEDLLVVNIQPRHSSSMCILDAKTPSRFIVVANSFAYHRGLRFALLASNKPICHRVFSSSFEERLRVFL